jgi:PQQ-dependent dehydrogenase (methanol/ethanol family)
MGPRLAASRRLRTRTVAQLSAFIRQGNPSAGMPAFNLPDAELEALAAYVHSLNSPASETDVQGDRVGGEKFFFGEGNCTNCHMVHGRGKPNGPDLSSTGRELTVTEIKEALLHPGRRITPGYELVTVHLRDGKTIRGFARARTNFDLVLQTLDGRLIPLQQSAIASILEERQSPMKPVDPSAARDLIAYLSGLTGVSGTAPLATSNPPIAPQPGDWLTYNGNVSGNRYSLLTQIDVTNVHQLTPKWIFPIDHFGIEVTPLVANGIMYVTGPDQAWALDALSGRVIWHYARPRSTGLVGDASLGTNRGVAIHGGNVFMVTDNAHLLALNRLTGALVWDVYMPEEPQHYGSTIAPLIVSDTIIAGVSGGDWGMRGFIACYDVSTGERLWRHWTIPLKGEPGSETWKGTEPLYGGGSTWLTGSYDPETDTLYWPTGNPWPDSKDQDRPGDNLFTDCILALDPHTGALKWHYQFTPHDVHDWDATEPPVLIDTQYQGSPRKLLLHADRNGFFYVLDRTNGKVLLTSQLLRRVTWAKGIGPDGRPIPAPPSADGLMCPADGANWNSAAFSPATRLYYLLTLEQCRQERPGATEPVPQKFVRAIDIDTGKIAWEIPQIGSVYPKTWPGILATAGGIVFYGDPNGAFAAVDERNGKPLWHFATNVYMKASPMTYSVNGKQFVAVAAGPNIISFGLPD